MDPDLPYVKEVDGQLVLIDPAAAALVDVVNRHNLGNTYSLNRDRIEHFVRRVAALGKTAADTVITCINVDDQVGGILAEKLMPGFDWRPIRAAGQVPFARGLAGREGIQGFLDLAYPEVGRTLRAAEGLCVVVVDHGTAAIFRAPRVT